MNGSTPSPDSIFEPGSPAIGAVIWDFGGVLVRTEDYTGRLKWAKRLGMNLFELEEVVFSSDSGRRAQLGEQNDADHWEFVRQALGLPGTELRVFQKDFWGGDRLDLRLVDLIRSLRPAYKTGLLSNHFPSLRGELQVKWQMEDAFDAIVISAEVGLLKPDPRIYQLMLEKLKVPASTAVFIDDFPHNLVGAAALGIQSLQFLTPDQVCADLGKLLDGGSG